MTKGFASYPRSRLGRFDPFDLASVLLIGGLLVLALSTLHHYAISNDEEVQHRYGELILAYYASGFANLTLFRFETSISTAGCSTSFAVLIG